MHALSVTGNDTRHVDFRQRHRIMRTGGRARTRAMMPMMASGARGMVGEYTAQTQVGSATPDNVTQRNCSVRKVQAAKKLERESVRDLSKK